MKPKKIYSSVFIADGWDRMGVDRAIKLVKDSGRFITKSTTVVFIESPLARVEQAVLVLRGLGCSSAIHGVTSEIVGDRPLKVLLCGSMAGIFDPIDFNTVKKSILLGAASPRIEFLGFTPPLEGWDSWRDKKPRDWFFDGEKNDKVSDK